MEHMESQGGNETARQEHGMPPGQPGYRKRRHERRDVDGIRLFGGYEGPERRSGRDRRESA